MAKKQAGRPPSPNPRKELVGCRATEEEAAKWRAKAERTGEAISDVIRRLLNRWASRPSRSRPPRE